MESVVMASGVIRRRTLIGLRRIRIGLPVDASDGWLVNYGGNLLAVLSAGEGSEVHLAAGFEDPFVSVMMSWQDLAAARADFIEVARLYRAGVVPAMITLEETTDPN